MIPSWREAAVIILPTLVGAFCGLRFPIPKMGPVFFQSVVAAVIPFEIASASIADVSVFDDDDIATTAARGSVSRPITELASRLLTTVADQMSL